MSRGKGSESKKIILGLNIHALYVASGTDEEKVHSKDAHDWLVTELARNLHEP